MSPKKPFVAGNWKMNCTIPEARKLIQDILALQPDVQAAALALLPPFTALAEAARLLAGSAVGLGAQDLHWEASGAFTGEISGPMLRDAGCAYVLVGHSERRALFGETDDTVNLKLGAALRAGLTPILCFGETLEEREAGLTMATVERQLGRGLAGLAPAEAGGLVFAYEPVWAIGTGRTASPAQAQEVQAWVRTFLAGAYGNDLALHAIILYGGSVKPENAFSLYSEKDVDGFLVGGASLKAGSFIGIAREALRAAKDKPWAH